MRGRQIGFKRLSRERRETDFQVFQAFVDFFAMHVTQG